MLLSSLTETTVPSVSPLAPPAHEVAAHRPGLEGTRARGRGGVGRGRARPPLGAARAEPASRGSAGIGGRPWHASRPPTLRWWSRRAGPGRAGRRDRERPWRRRRGAPCDGRWWGAGRHEQPRPAVRLLDVDDRTRSGHGTALPAVARRHGHEHDVSGHRLGPASGAGAALGVRGAGIASDGGGGHDRVCPPSAPMRPTGAFPERRTSGSSWPQGAPTRRATCVARPARRGRPWPISTLENRRLEESLSGAEEDA